VSRVDTDFLLWARLPRLLHPINWFGKEVEFRETVQLYSNLPPEETMEKRLVVPLVGLAISLALPTFAQPKDTGGSQIVQQRDLLGVPDALAKFDELLHKLEEA
jgi:hypothetical protein